MSEYVSLRPADDSPHIQCSSKTTEQPGVAPVPRSHRNRHRKVLYDYDPELCQRRARYSIDGKPYCSTHAGILALQEKLRENPS